MAECSNPGVEPEATFALICKEVFDFVGRDFSTVLVAGTFCNNNNCLALPDVAMLYNGLLVTWETLILKSQNEKERFLLY